MLFSVVQKAGTSQKAIETAYKAAAVAASQLRAGKKPFLVMASAGPEFTARGGYKVQTQPLGFHKRPRNERVRTRLHLQWPLQFTA